MSATVRWGVCGVDLTWTLDTETGILNIDGTGDMYDYNDRTFGKSPWYSYKSDIKSLVVDDSVTSISDYAFYHSESLTSATIGDSATNIGSHAFYGCEALTSITIPDSVTDIDGGAFGNTAYSKDSDNWNNGVLYIADHLIYVKQSVSGSYVIRGGTKSIADCAFQNCDNLTSVTIPDSVTSIGDRAFSNCISLTRVTIGDSVASIGEYAFDHCTSLTSVTIPDSVTSISEYAFWDCISLYSVTIGSSVTSIGDYAFRLCNSLKSVTIGNSVTSIGEWAFLDCFDLSIVTIPDSVTSISSSAFLGCSADIMIVCSKDSYAYDFTLKRNYRVHTECSFSKYVSDENYTCEQDGTMTAVCDDECGKTDTVTDIGSKLTHRYNNYVYNNDATCTEDGTRTSPCDYGCGRTKTKVAEKTAFGHDYKKNSTKAALCTEPGETLYRCTRCAYSHTENIAARGHRYENACDADCNVCGDIRNVEPHCVKKNLYNIDNNSQYPFILKDGIYTSSNKRDDSSGSMTLTVLNDCSITIDYYTSTEHKYDKLIIIHNSTTEVTASGDTSWSSVTISVTKGDEICLIYSKDNLESGGFDEVYFKLSPSEGAYNADDEEATCLDSVVCDVCGTIVKDALGHSFTNYVSKNNATCTADGTKTARCDRCNVTDTQNDEGSALGHSFTNYVSDGNTTCTEDGTKTAKCDRCDATDTVTDTSEMAEHVYGE